MELFFASKIDSGAVRLSSEESLHCVKVLRHRVGDAVEVIDGAGTLFHCTMLDADPREAVLRIDSSEEGWNALPYRLTLGICPTKNPDRFDWAVEKATEFGVDSIVPIIAERSERRVFKADRARRIALSATKQSLKALVPTIPDPTPFRDFLASAGENHEACGNTDGACPAVSHDGGLMAAGGQLRLIACCFDGAAPRVSVREALEAHPDATDIAVLIGPEGDFSPEEVTAAVAAGFIPVHLGDSRLRTETAAVAAAAFIYYSRLPWR